MSKRRHNRCFKPVQPRKLDQPVLMFGYAQTGWDWRHWSYRTLSVRKAEEMRAASEAELITRKTPNGIVSFYRETRPARASRTSPCTLTMATTLAVARAKEKLTSGGKAHVVKFCMWPLVTDHRNAATITPRMSVRDMVLAQKMMEQADGVRARPTHGGTERCSYVRAEFYDEPASAA